MLEELLTVTLFDVLAGAPPVQVPRHRRNHDQQRVHGEEPQGRQQEDERASQPLWRLARDANLMTTVG